MNQEREVWLSISLFCDRVNWHCLISDGVRSFLYDSPVACLINSFCIELSYEVADNIRLFILASESAAEIISMSAQEKFNHFFQYSDFSANSSSVDMLTFKGLFLPFSYNTIQFGVCVVPQVIRNVNSYGFCFEKMFSKLLLALLASRPFDEEDLLSYVFYIHFAWIKVLRQSNVEASIKSAYLNYYKINNHELDEVTKESMLSIHGSVKEIHREVMECNKTIGNQDISWVKEWLVLYQDFIGNEYLSMCNMQNGDYISVSSMIDKQLGYSNGKIRLLISGSVYDALIY